MNNSQCGSAIVWIFIAVSLFAALTYAFNSGSRTSVGFLSDAQADGYADEIIAYGNEVKTAVRRLQLRGCNDDEVNFDNNLVAGYTNPSAPVGNKCDIFQTSGGGLRWNVAQNSALSTPGDFAIVAANEIDGVGSDCAAASCSELVIFLSNIKQEVCMSINDSLGIPNPSGAPPTDTTFTETPEYVGTFSYVTTIGDEVGGAVLSGEKTGCFQETSGSTNIYYNVLIDQ